MNDYKKVAAKKMNIRRKTGEQNLVSFNESQICIYSGVLNKSQLIHK